MNRGWNLSIIVFNSFPVIWKVICACVVIIKTSNDSYSVLFLWTILLKSSGRIIKGSTSEGLYGRLCLLMVPVLCRRCSDNESAWEAWNSLRLEVRSQHSPKKDYDNTWKTNDQMDFLNIHLWNNWKICYEKKQSGDIDAWRMSQGVLCYGSPHWMVKTRSEELT